jgi:hypothetical protein
MIDPVDTGHQTVILIQNTAFSQSSRFHVETTRVSATKTVVIGIEKQEPLADAV